MEEEERDPPRIAGHGNERVGCPLCGAYAEHQSVVVVVDQLEATRKHGVKPGAGLAQLRFDGRCVLSEEGRDLRLNSNDTHDVEFYSVLCASSKVTRGGSLEFFPSRL